MNYIINLMCYINTNFFGLDIKRYKHSKKNVYINGIKNNVI